MNVFDRIFSQVNEIFSKSLMQGAPSCGSLGVDIGSYSVKIVRLEMSKDGAKVLGFGVEKVVNRNYRDAISKALVKAKALQDQSAVISVSGQGVVSRYIDLPFMNKSELESSMKFEIEKYVPFPLAEVSSDFAVMHEMRDKAKMSVLVAAAKNDLICLALANFAAEIAGLREKGTCSCIINIGKTVSNIDILVDGSPCLSRDIFSGGEDFTKKLAETLEIEYAEAEELKLEPGSKKDELCVILDSVLNNFAAEIRVSLDYFEARNNRAVDNIFITGGSGRLAGIDSYLSHLLAVDIKKLDYAGRLRLDETLDAQEFKANSDLLAIALGLALR
jgi:type IV pilus assembly protein PilM